MKAVPADPTTDYVYKPMAKIGIDPKSYFCDYVVSPLYGYYILMCDSNGNCVYEYVLSVKIYKWVLDDLPYEEVLLSCYHEGITTEIYMYGYLIVLK